MKKYLMFLVFYGIFSMITIFAQTPNPPTNISVNQQDQSTNIITWDDETVITGETYNVYISESPISDVSATGVVKIGRKIAEGTGTFTHTAYTPTDRGTLDYYYAVTSVALDGSENPTVSGGQNASQNAAPSVTIAVGSIALISTPVVIDGNLSEFINNAIPFVIDGTRRVEGAGVFNWLEGPENWTGNDDHSGNVYLMMDQENLYFGADVKDQSLVQNFTGFGTWNGDAPELNIGLYHLNGLETRHQTNYKRAAEPDYQFRFSIGDETWMHVPWPGFSNEGLPSHVADYIEIITIPTISQDGYTMEVRIPFSGLVSDPEILNHPGGPDSLFHPEDGMLLPFDITLNDADNPNVNYEGNFYYYWGDTTSFRPFVSPKWWGWTLIGKFDTVTGINDEPGSPGVANKFDLAQNYPNPFNPSTTIEYTLPQSGDVQLKIYDITGSLVETLINGFQAGGNHTVTFQSKNLASGIYLYQLSAGNFQQVKKMILMK